VVKKYKFDARTPTFMLNLNLIYQKTVGFNESIQAKGNVVAYGKRKFMNICLERKRKFV